MGKKTLRTFSWEFKEKAARRMLGGERPTDLSRELKVPRQILYEWRDQYRKGGNRLWHRAEGRPEDGIGSLSGLPECWRINRAKENQLGELERKVGQQQLVIDFLQEALRRVEDGPAQTNSFGENGSIPTSER